MFSFMTIIRDALGLTTLTILIELISILKGGM